MSRFITICFYLGLLYLAGCGQGSGHPVIPETEVELLIQPLLEQHESKYVTDSALWGRLLFIRDNLVKGRPISSQSKAIGDVIESFHRHWLDRNHEELQELLYKDVFRHRQGSAAYGRDAVIRMIEEESRGERPAGYKSSMQLSLRDVDIRIASEALATAVYKIDIRGGARWEYADMATVLQVFILEDDNWKIVAHSETLTLGDDNAPALPDNVPTRVSPFTFSFAYPVSDLERAIQFYTPLLGEPLTSTPNTASFRVGRSYFELTAKPPDPRIVIKPGKGNGYGVVNVPSLEMTQKKLVLVGTTEYSETPCEEGRCIVSEDPSGNVIVWRELTQPPEVIGTNPAIIVTGRQQNNPWHTAVIGLMTGWMHADIDKILPMIADETLWLDDASGMSTGHVEIRSMLEKRWANLAAGSKGIPGELSINRLRSQSIDSQYLITFEADLKMYKKPKVSEKFLITQIWSAEARGLKLEKNFIVSARQDTGELVRGMDYTAYPVDHLGMAGGYYKMMFGSEPYRDTNWFGFWSTSSVFGLVGRYADENAYNAIPHRSNGYADLSIGSAEAVYEYLRKKGAKFPRIRGINDIPGIDPQPGYRQILAIDSEGNLINFSEYLEY